MADKPASEAWDDALAVFAKDVGTWDAEIEVRVAPGAPPQRSTGVSHNRMECGGKWLVVDFTADSGFSGHGVYGYDPAKGRYVGLWVDNMRSFAAVSEGTWDARTRTMEFVTEANLQGGPTRWRDTTHSEGDDRQVMRTFFPSPDGGEREVMTITYRRRAT